MMFGRPPSFVPKAGAERRRGGEGIRQPPAGRAPPRGPAAPLQRRRRPRPARRAGLPLPGAPPRPPCAPPSLRPALPAPRPPCALNPPAHDRPCLPPWLPAGAAVAQSRLPLHRHAAAHPGGPPRAADGAGAALRCPCRRPLSRVRAARRRMASGRRPLTNSLKAATRRSCSSGKRSTCWTARIPRHPS